MIAYLMKEKGMGLWEAFNLTRSKRSIVCPNPGFMKQLQEYEKELKKEADARAKSEKLLSEEKETTTSIVTRKKSPEASK